MTILATGGTGFLGSYFTRHAVQNGERVILLDRAIDRGCIADVPEKVTPVEGGVGDCDLVAKLMGDLGVGRIARICACNAYAGAH